MIEYLEIGKIINTHGIKGEVKVLPLTDDPRRYNSLKNLYIEDKQGLRKCEIDYVRYHKGFVLVKFKGIDNMDDAEKLKESVLKVHRSDAVKLPEGSYFICDIIGLHVFDEDANEIGQIKDIIKTGSNDVYVVARNNKEVLIPALKTIVKNIDTTSGKMIVDLPEGILEDEI